MRSGAGILSQYPKYSIVIPAFNESARIPATLESVIACIREKGWDAEVIVVNDGSTDSTAQLVLDMAGEAPEIRLLENPGNRGKGLCGSQRHSARTRRHRDVHRFGFVRAHRMRLSVSSPPSPVVLISPSAPGGSQPAARPIVSPSTGSFSAAASTQFAAW